MENDKKGEISEAEKIETANNRDKATKEAPSVSPKSSECVDKKCCGNAAIVMSVLALVMGGCGLGFGLMAYQKSSTPLTFLNNGADGNSANFVEGSIAEIADKVSASVVSIVTSTKTRNFFGQDYESAAAGTGIIVTSDGYILTNKHVINGATSINVVLDDGTTYENVELVARIRACFIKEA